MSRMQLALRVAERLRDGAFVDRHIAAVEHKYTSRAKAKAKVPEWEAIRARASELRARYRPRLPELVERFREQATKRGAHVHFAADAEAANRAVWEIVERVGARQIVKSKSMTTEECGLNPYLEERGCTVIDTDLGERIVQMFGEPPSHITGPAIHRSRQEIGALFAEHGLCEAGEEDPTRLTMAARRALRELFLRAELGMSGANFLVADQGAAVVVENEANSLLGTSLPHVHIVVAGIDKLIPGQAELATFLALLARSATGQRISSYTTSYAGPQPRTEAERALGLPERELHIVLLDGGRSGLVGTPAEQALDCIRCGACLNVCPVYRRIGGHSYGSVYPGPIGKTLGPGLFGADELPMASSLCGACSEVCPVGIDLARQIHDWRGTLTSEGRAKTGLPPLLGDLMQQPKLWRAGLRMARALSFVSGPILRATPQIRAWTAGGERRLPELPKQSFRTWLRKRPAEDARPASLQGAVEPRPVRASSPEHGPYDVGDPRGAFVEALEEAGGRVQELAELPEGAVVTAKAAELLRERGIERARAPVDKDELNGQDALVITARYAIARIGAVWLDFGDLESRAQALLSEELLVLVPADAIVPDLPDHAERLAQLPETPCGTILAGPSKTADIERTLVFGAHGPKQLSVIFV
jgi:L-lactate dehydrogenase complex protein LldF